MVIKSLKILYLKRSVCKLNQQSFFVSRLASSPLKCKKFFKLAARKFYFPKYNTFFQNRFVSFLDLGSSLLKYKKFFRVFVSWNIRKASFWENKNFFNTRPRKFHSLKYKKIVFFYYFSSYFCKTLQNVGQYSEYTSSSK